MGDIVKSLAWLRYRVRWWRWFLSYPNWHGPRVKGGADGKSLGIIWDRHDAQEPKPPEQE